MDFTDISTRGLVLLGCGKMGSAMLQGWLAADDPTRLPDWDNPAIAEPESVPEALSRGAGLAPLLFFLPGIMGSRLEADGDPIWLEPLRLAGGGLKRIAMVSKAEVSTDGLVDLALDRGTASIFSALPSPASGSRSGRSSYLTSSRMPSDIRTTPSCST